MKNKINQPTKQQMSYKQKNQENSEKKMKSVSFSYANFELEEGEKT